MVNSAENWYVIINEEENIAIVKEYFEPIFPVNRIYSVGSAYGIIKGVAEARIDGAIYELQNKGGVEISMERFKSLVEEGGKNLVGYDVKPEFKILAEKAFDTTFERNSKLDKMSFCVNSILEKRIEAAGVLDLWFNKVYKELDKFPEFSGYKGKVEGEYLVYGCQKVHTSIFDLGLCNLQSLMIHNNNVDIMDIQKIRKALKK